MIRKGHLIVYANSEVPVNGIYLHASSKRNNRLDFYDIY